MTDYEINKAIGKLTGLATTSEPVFEMVVRNSTGRAFRPTVDWSDGGPLLKEYRISVEAAIKGDNWVAQIDNFAWTAVDKEPLRAAMKALVLFLGGKK